MCNSDFHRENKFFNPYTRKPSFAIEKTWFLDQVLGNYKLETSSLASSCELRRPVVESAMLLT